jgi:hypothetical protein
MSARSHAMMTRFDLFFQLVFNLSSTTNSHKIKRVQTTFLIAFVFPTHIGRCLHSTELLADSPLASPIALSAIVGISKNTDFVVRHV